jgi:alginate O-acetyltransferase complex protein AlgI
MVFSSIIFLFLFLPLTLALYFFSGRRLSNIFLLLASLIFYSWGEGFFVLLLLASILANYLSGILLAKYRSHKLSQFILFIAIALNLALLGYWKYADFIIANCNYFFSFIGMKSLIVKPNHLPIGISFFSFSGISYVLDVYWGKARAQANIINLALYIALFPKLIAGPIVRYVDIEAEISKRTITLDKFAGGLERFIYGLGKKVLIANTLSVAADHIFSIPVYDLTLPVAWVGIVCYTLQIYFDFSGYSDMAIGLGRMFGFSFIENFNYPYISESVQDFWRRWHISLSSWFRDYLYIPMGGNRKGTIRTCVNIFTVFFLVGWWHGASWNFIIWGIYYGLFLIVERLGFRDILERFWKPLRHAYVVLIVMVGWVFFRAETLRYAVDYLLVMFGFIHAAGTQYNISMFLNRELTITLLAAILFSMPILLYLKQFEQALLNKTSGVKDDYIKLILRATRFAALTILLILSLSSVAASTYNPFIYFKF